MYGMTMSEVSAVNTWVKDYMIGEDLVSGLVQAYPKPLLKEQVSDYVRWKSLAQIPPTTGLCFRTTDFTPEALEMLKTGASGIRSKGPPGIYEVQGKSRYNQTW